MRAGKRAAGLRAREKVGLGLGWYPRESAETQDAETAHVELKRERWSGSMVLKWF